MPVVRPPPRRRSARLKALQTPFPRGKNAMDPTQGPVTRGRGSKSRGTRHPAVGGGSDHPKFQIQWLSAPFRTQKVIDHLRDHPADCRILFSSDAKRPQNDSDRPSGKDKLSVCAVIANITRTSPTNFETRRIVTSMDSEESIASPMTSYTQPAAGIMPEDEAQNLHAQILKEFPWYDELIDIMGGNPAISLKTVSSHPGVDHAAKYFSISRTAGSSYSNSLGSGSAQFSAQPFSPQLPPAGAQPYSPQLPPSASQPYPPSYPQPYPPSDPQPYPPSGAQPYPPSNTQPYPPSGAQPYAPSGAQHYPPSGAQPYAPSGAQHYPPSGAQPHGSQYAFGHAPHSQYPHHHQSGAPPARSRNDPNSLLDDDDDDMDFSFEDLPKPTPPPRRDYRDDPHAIILDSPPRSARAASKRPAPPSSPSPPITPPPQSQRSEFMLPRTSQTSHRDSRASFGMSDPQRRPSTGSVKASSRRSSGSSRSKPASASSAPASTSMTSPANSASASAGKTRQGKKQRSDLQSQVDALSDEIESAQSDRVTRDELKNERYMAKYNFARQVNEHKFLKAERADTFAEAATAHQRALEAKESEIRLREAEMKMHAALAQAHAEEAATMRLKIEFARLSGSGSGSGSQA
ncbi:hypothetical protein DFJ58DRAFT_891157 [Suillus subalutaceus]|uniref:uncharacterized protein n=1 Tax=Suillus subalutaceus TaxID=48586 RepID=UPI001B872877|nr:uncharacterized protein DFJ58DRAFT_891157 [Suillus subalutaceus]KAG1847832.1 hypothetical protein DFJ58DRAFT_891157 [Suillus subalutaceus]